MGRFTGFGLLEKWVAERVLEWGCGWMGGIFVWNCRARGVNSPRPGRKMLNFIQISRR
jgi:hypothetical protein